MRLTPPPESSRLAALTSFRFIASAMIVIQHVKWYFTFLEPVGGLAPLELGVSFFYVLSGFVLFHKYPVLPTPEARRRFLAMRVARVWPLHLCVLLLSALFIRYPWSYPIGPNLFDTAAIGLLLQAWAPWQKTVFGINGVSWSVSVELFFYAMFPLLIGNFARSWAWKLAAAAAVALGIVVSADALGLPVLVWGENKLSAEALAFIFPPSRLLEFLLGLCACAAVRRVRQRIVLGPLAWTVAEAAALGLAIAAMGQAWPLGAYAQRLGLGPAEAKWCVESGCGPAFALLIAVFALSKGYLNRIIANRALTFLGEISFSTYMLHVPLFMVMQAHGVFRPGYGAVANALLFAACLIAASALSWWLVEQRGRRLGMLWWARLGQRAEAL